MKIAGSATLTKIYTYWKSRLLEEAKLYKSLKFMDKHLTFGKVHPLAKSTTYNIKGHRKNTNTS
jgi:hypothetical protein